MDEKQFDADNCEWDENEQLRCPELDTIKIESITCPTRTDDPSQPPKRVSKDKPESFLVV